MNRALLFVLAGIAGFVFAGCATQQSGSDSGKVRTAYKVPAHDGQFSYIVPADDSYRAQDLFN